MQLGVGDGGAVDLGFQHVQLHTGLVLAARPRGLLRLRNIHSACGRVAMHKLSDEANAPCKGIISNLLKIKDIEENKGEKKPSACVAEGIVVRETITKDCALRPPGQLARVA